ncbi:MAG: 4Fe-4S dicluster domain-containing protein [Candidatus Lokiarchaeota archaeon]|nr:4Fe-4S dicluster domain-containing protein [Candidatus Lokiarchaeota archaeon]
MKKVHINEEVCIGCRLCEIWCIVEHSKSKDIIKAFKKENPRAATRIRVEENKPISFGVQCRHCNEPLCVYSCISGAMYLDNATGLVLHDENKCVGCWTCILVCPYGAITRDENGKTALKCDMCLERGTPSCVEHCPNEGLTLIEVIENEC